MSDGDDQKEASVHKQTMPHTVKVDVKISKESRLSALVIPSITKNMLQRSAARWLTGWEQGEIDDLDDGYIFNGVLITFCGHTYELQMMLVEEMDYDIVIGKDWDMVGKKSAKEMRDLAEQAKSEHVTIKCKVKLTKEEEETTAVLCPQNMLTTISETLAKRMSGLDTLKADWLNVAEEFTQITITYHEQTMTIAAQIISEALGSPDLILGRDWLNRQTDATVRIVSVDRHEVNSITMDTCVQLGDPSAIMVVLDSKFSGGNTMEFKEERMLVNRGPEVLQGHTKRPSETNEGIWFCLSVLNADWDNFVIAEQRSIEDRTTEINQWTVLEGTKLVRYLRDQQNPKITTERHQSIDESLVTAALDPSLTPRCRQRLMYFYAEFAEKTRDLRKRVSALRNSMRLGLKGQGNSEDPAKRVLLNKIGPDYSGPSNEISQEGVRLTKSNQIHNDGSQEGPRCGNNRQGDDTGSSRNSQAQSLVAPLNYQSAERKAREYTSESTFLPQNQKLTAYALEEAITVTARKDQALDLEDLPVPSTVGSRVQVVTKVEEAPVDSLRFFEALDGIDNHRQELMKFEALIRARKIGLELDALKAAKLTLEGTKHGAPPVTTRNIGLGPEDISGDTEKESGIEAAVNHSSKPGSVPQGLGLTKNDSQTELKGTEKRNSDDLANSKLSSTPGSNPRLATGSLKAPTTSRHFFDTPSDIGHHWKQLDMLEGARKISLKEMAQQTGKLTMDKASYAPMPPIMNRMIGDNSKPPPGYTEEDLSLVNYLGTDLLETRMAGQGSIRKNSAEQIQLDLPKERLNSIGSCVLAARGPEQAKARQMTELEVVQTKSNLETRRKARRISIASINTRGIDDEGQNQAPSKLNQTEPDMSNNSGGSAATALPPGVAVGLASGEHNASPPEISPDYHSAYFMGTNAVCPDGIHMSAVSTFARNISRDDRSTDGTRYDSVLRTVRIHPHGLHELLASSRVRSLPYDLAGLAKVDTLVFESCSIDRRYQMGNGTIFHPGHLVVTGNPCDNIGRVLQPRHAMYPELQECIEMQKAALKADGGIGTHHPDDYVQPVGLFEFDLTKPQRYQEHRKLPNVQLETDFVRLHHITKGLPKAPRYVVCQVVPAQIREEGELGFGPVITQPGPNYAQQLINEVARQVVMVSDRSVHEAHFRRPMRANPDALRYLTRLMSPKQQEAFIGIATVFTFLHGIDALQRRPERARVTMPLAHLDLIIRLSMEPVPDGELYEPNIFEREFQFYLRVLYQLQPMVKTEWAGLGYRPDKDVEERISTLPSRPVLQIQPHNRDQVHTLFVDNMNHFDTRPRNSDTEPDPIRIHIDDAMVDLPVSTALCERVLSTRENAEETGSAEWERLPKIVQDGVSARATSCIATYGYNPCVTEVHRFNLDASAGHEVPAVDLGNFTDTQQYGLSNIPITYSLHAIAIAAAKATAIASNSHEASTAPINFPAIVSPAPIIQAARENALDAISPGSQLQTGQQLSVRAKVTSNPTLALINDTERNIPTRTTATGTMAPEASQSLLSKPAQLLSAQLDRISTIAPESAEKVTSAAEENQPIASRSSPDVSLVDPSARRYTEPGRDPGSKKIRTDNRGIQVPSETLPEQRPRANSLPNPFERLSLEDAPTITLNVDSDIRPIQQNSASEPYELEEGEIREDEEMPYWDGITGPQSSGENSSMQGTAPASRTASERRRDFSGDSSGGDEPRFIATNPVPVPTIYNNLLPPSLPPLPAPRPVAQVHAVFTDLQRSPLPPNPAPDIPRQKRKRLEDIDRARAVAPSSSTSENLVLGAIANIGGGTATGAQVVIDDVAMANAQDFWSSRQTTRRPFLDELQSIKKSQHYLQPVSLEHKRDGKLRTYQRPRHQLDIVDDDSDAGGDELSTEERRGQGEEKGTEAKERDVAASMANESVSEFELMGQSNEVASNHLDSAATSPPESTIEEDMDTSSDDYTGQYRGLAVDDKARDQPRTLLSVEPQQVVIMRGSYTLAQMYHFWVLYDGQVCFPDSKATPEKLEQAEFIQIPSVTHDPFGYRDSGKFAVDETTNSLGEYNVQLFNPDFVPGPDHPLYRTEEVRRLVLVKRSTLAGYPPELQEYRQRIGQEEMQKGAVSELGQRALEACRNIHQGMRQVRPSVGDYWMLDGTRASHQAEYARDRDKFDRYQEAGPGESIMTLGELPQVAATNAYELPPASTHEMLEYVVPVNRDIAEAVHEGDEQEEERLERVNDPLRLFRQLSASPTRFQQSPYVYWLSPLRQLRGDVEILIQNLVAIMRLSPVRQVVNRIPEDHATKHFFRYHCSFLRLIEKGVLVSLQGFNVECLHSQAPVSRYTVQPVAKYQPRNPLLLEEEDEFFFHCTVILEHFGMFELVNSIQQVRGTHLWRPKDVRTLLRHGYLDSLDYFDHLGFTTGIKFFSMYIFDYRPSPSCKQHKCAPIRILFIPEGCSRAAEILSEGEIMCDHCYSHQFTILSGTIAVYILVFKIATKFLVSQYLQMGKEQSLRKDASEVIEGLAWKVREVVKRTVEVWNARSRDTAIRVRASRDWMDARIEWNIDHWSQFQTLSLDTRASLGRIIYYLLSDIMGAGALHFIDHEHCYWNPNVEWWSWKVNVEKIRKVYAKNPQAFDDISNYHSATNSCENLDFDPDEAGPPSGLMSQLVEVKTDLTTSGTPRKGKAMFIQQSI
ncbi:hypothetical protein C8J56DRAFT_1065477 [Mycena floridula]|nr:hypothetical protein C8J56DRAFT_1065477 [Mycena floridula]